MTEEVKTSFAATLLQFLLLSPLQVAYVVFVLHLVYNWHAPHFSLPAASAGHVLFICTAKAWWHKGLIAQMHEIAERVKKKNLEVVKNFFTSLITTSVVFFLGWVATKLY